MAYPYDMTLFLSGVLTGSQAKQQRHLRQAQIIQAAIQERWKINNPWRWKLKHFLWLNNVYLKNHAESSRYYYQLTINLIAARTGNPELAARVKIRTIRNHKIIHEERISEQYQMTQT
jgi:hypothetical protein